MCFLVKPRGSLFYQFVSADPVFLRGVTITFRLRRVLSGCAGVIPAASVVIDSYSLGYQTAEPA